MQFRKTERKKNIKHVEDRVRKFNIGFTRGLEENKRENVKEATFEKIIAWKFVKYINDSYNQFQEAQQSRQGK